MSEREGEVVKVEETAKEVDKVPTAEDVAVVYASRTRDDVPAVRAETIKRGFSEAVIDLGSGNEPDPVAFKALEALQILGLCNGVAVVPKVGEPGLYAHVIFDPVQFVALDRVIAFSTNEKTSAVAFEDFPPWSLRDGGRAHVFMGVGDSEEKQPVKEVPPEPEPPKEEPPAPPKEEPVKPSRLASMMTRVRDFFTA